MKKLGNFLPLEKQNMDQERKYHDVNNIYKVTETDSLSRDLSKSCNIPTRGWGRKES